MLKPSTKDYIARTIKAYDDTETYESNTRLVVPEAELEQFVGMLNIGESVLDAGCAYGRDTEYLAKKGLAVSGIDLSPALIKRAKELQPAISFTVCDVRKTNFSDGTFDGIWCNATLLHLN